MIYYKVKKEFDNKRIHPFVKNNQFLIANELYTEKELNKLFYNGLRFYKDYLTFFDKIEISKNKTYFFFGARFME